MGQALFQGVPDTVSFRPSDSDNSPRGAAGVGKTDPGPHCLGVEASSVTD